MLLIELPGRRWSLIDCNLKNEDVRNHFFETVKREKITRLDYLFLTHPHHDHYLGMADVVDYFTRDGRRIGTFCDVGASPKDVVSILAAAGRPDRHVQPYVDLVRRLVKLFDDKHHAKVEYEPLHERVYPLPVDVSAGASMFIPVGPRSDLVPLLVRRALAGESVRRLSNAISLVVLLLARFDDKECQMLLAGDAETNGLKRALDKWREHPENDDKKVHLDIVKVPHHGSRTGRSEQLVKAKRENATGVAAISVDTLYRLPKADVIKMYHDAGWTVVATTTRLPPSSPDLPIAAFARPPSDDSQVHREDVEVCWSADTGKITWAPRDAEIRPEDRHRYPA